MDHANPATGMLRLFAHHLYEHRKGVRQLFMMTMTAAEAATAQARLQREGIAHLARPVSAAKVNLFFGRESCVQVVRGLVTKPLAQLSPEEDFILGTLLGYELDQQCLRFLAKSKSGRPQAVAAVA